MFISESKYLIKAPPFKPIHTCNDRTQPHPPPTSGLQRRSVARVYAASRHCKEASGRPQPDLMTRRREELANRSVAASRRREEATSPPAASQRRSIAKTRRHSSDVAQRREDAKTRGAPSGVAASQRCDNAKTRNRPQAISQRRSAETPRRRESRLAASQCLTASEPTWRTHCIYIYRDVYKRFILCICLMSVQICRFIQVFSVYRRLSRHATPSPQEPVPTSQEAGIWLGKWSIDG